MATILTIEGLGDVEITNWEEFKEKLLKAIGFQMVNEIQAQIKKMALIDTSEYWQSIDSEIDSGDLVIFSTVPYAPYLEYGTLQYWNIYGLGNFPSKPHPKKKNLKPEQRKHYPKGMQPFAPFRRVFYNENKMTQIIQKAADAAGRTS